MVTGLYHAEFLDLFQLDNALITHSATNCCSISRLDDFPSFPNLNKSLARQKFKSNKEVITDTDAHFEDLQKKVFFRIVKKKL